MRTYALERIRCPIVLECVVGYVHVSPFDGSVIDSTRWLLLLCFSPTGAIRDNKFRSRFCVGGGRCLLIFCCGGSGDSSVAAKHWRQVGVGWFEVGRSVDWLVAAPNKCCLLYTSDAADE